jgi:uncharacterized caspase-like protein
VLHDDTAGRDGILAALDGLAARVGADDTVLLYFCGHGLYGQDGDYYLSTHDTRLKDGKVMSAAAACANGSSSTGCAPSRPGGCS